MVLVEGFIIFAEFTSFEPLVAAQYQAVAIMCGLIIQNVMACRVFRSLRSGSYGNTYTQSIFLSTMRFAGDAGDEESLALQLDIFHAT